MKSKVFTLIAVVAAAAAFTGCTNKNEVSRSATNNEIQEETSDNMAENESIEAYDGRGNENGNGIISDVADGVGEAVTEITDDVSEGMSKAGNVVEDAAESISSAIDMR